MITVDEFKKQMNEAIDNAVNGSVIDPRVINELLIKLQMDCKYKAQYFYNDPMGSTFSNDSCYILIAFSDNEEELIQYCESKGYKRSTKLFDGGYEIEKTDPFGFYKQT